MQDGTHGANQAASSWPVFRVRALYTDCNFGLVTVDPQQDQVVFRLYGMQKVSHPDGTAQDRPVTHSIAKLELRF